MGERAIASTNGYRLGLDWSNPPEGIDIQALTQAMNCEFDRTDNALRTVSGVTIAYDAGMSIDTLYTTCTGTNGTLHTEQSYTKRI